MGEEPGEAFELCQEETEEVPGEAEDQPWEGEEFQEDERELGEEALGEDGEPPPEEADSVWGCCNRFSSGLSVMSPAEWFCGRLEIWFAFFAALHLTKHQSFMLHRGGAVFGTSLVCTPAEERVQIPLLR